MNNDDILDENEVKVEVSSDLPISHSKLPIERIEENCSNEEESSDESSPSALKKRLKDLSSTYDNIRSIDPLIPLNHRISRINRTDKEEHQNSNLLKESSATLNSLQGARARRRAKIRSEILHEIDKSLSMTNPKVTDLLNFLTQSENESKFVESSMESLESTKIYDGKDSSTIRFKPTMFTGTLTSRNYYCKDDDDDDDDKKQDLIQRQSKSAEEDRISKSNKLLKNKAEINSISHLSGNNVRPIKCGGYRPHTGVILKNLSSSSESESITEPTFNCASRKINSPIINTELSSPISRTTLDERILSVLSSRSEDNQALSSFRSLQEIPRNRIINNNDREKIQENDLMPPKSTLVSSCLKTLLTDEEKSYTGSENERQENSRMLREPNFNSIDELNIFSKHQKGKRIEHLSCPSSAKNCTEKEDFVLATNSARFCSSKEKIPSFMSVGLIDDLETFNASDNERHENTSVPSLRLYSEDVSCSTSAGSKTYTQNRSLDSSVLSNALSNVCSTLNAKDKENNSTKTRYKSFDDSENLDTSESSDRNMILTKTRQESVSTESKNIHERYNEFDIPKESRRAFSAPPSKLPAGHLVDDQRCKSVDLSQEMIYVRENLQYPESFYSNNCKTNLSESIGSLNFAEEYQTFKDPLEMSYLQEEKYNSYPLEYLISSMYPRQSHLSILQEESETKLEENDQSESTFENKDSSTINFDKENINRSKSTQQISTTWSKNQNIEQQNPIKLDKTNVIQNTIENSMENQCNLKEDSSSTNLTSAHSTKNKPDIQTKQEDKLKDVNEEGDNEYKTDKFLNDKIDRNNRVEGIGKDLKSLAKIDENSRLKSSKSVQANTAMFIIQNVHETCTVSPKVSCSTSRLCCTFEHSKKSPRFKSKKSQDRFPFTISETESMMFETRHDVRSKEGHCKNVTNKSRSLEMFRELTYPTIAEFLKSSDCYAYSERRNQRNILPKMKGFVRRFSNKLKASRKQNNDYDQEISTKIIYQNQDCQIDSIPESCSDESIIEESQLIVQKSGNTRSSIISSGKSLKKTMSLENLTLCTEYPRRRYDRDDRWVKEFQECSSQLATTRTSSKERFSIFPSKSESSSLVEDFSKGFSRLQEKNIERTTRKNEDSINVSISSTSPNTMETKVDVKKDKNPDIDEISINMESGCICLKLYRMLTCSFIATSKNRTSNKRNDALIEMKKKKRKKKFHLSSK